MDRLSRQPVGVLRQPHEGLDLPADHAAVYDLAPVVDAQRSVVGGREEAQVDQIS